MDVRAGYKLTEVGVIPEDWGVKRLGDLGSVVRGGSPRPAGDPRYFNGDFIPWLTVASLTNISEHALEVTETVGLLTEEGSKRSRTLLAGTLIISNSGATLGVAKILGVTCCANDGIAAIVNQQFGDKAFICFFINTQTKKLREVVATGNGQPNLNTALIRNLAAPYPPIPEQRAIAAALSDVDALLGGLERLIAKKRNVKQATMQQLLTGQTRLLGFRENWETVEFGDVAAIRNAKVFASSMPAGTQCVELESIGQGNGRLLVSTEATGPSSKYSFKKGDVLFGRLRAYLRKYWIATFDGVCSTEIWPLIVSDERLIGNFLHLLVQTNDFVNAAGVSYGTRMPRSDWSVLEKYPVRLPSVPEQTAIAEVLSDIDAELSALEARRDKTRALKQAMMQELLTGRIRLV